ncbi:MAG: MFS transporter, partial [Oscillospiraceae bacterium]|nr:MFS transporter [Oscillospiraceae bacterium]
LAMCGAVALVFTPIGGVMGDRWNKARIMFVCDYLKGALILLSAMLMSVFPGSDAHIVILFAAGLCANAVSGVFAPASGALLPHIVDEQRLQQATAYFSVLRSLQTIFGAVLAGVLYAALPIRALLLVVGICYLLSGISEMFIRYEHRQSKGRLTLKLALADMRDGFLYLRAQKPIMALMGAILFINFFFSPIPGNFIPYFVKTDVANAPGYLFDGLLTPELWSSAFSMLLGAGSLVGSAILSGREPREKCGRQTARRLCVVAAIVIALTVGYRTLVVRAVSLDGFLLLFSLGVLITGFLLPCINIPVSTALMRAVDRDKLSKVNSIIGILSQGLIPIASVLSGVVLRCGGSAALLLICSAGFTVTALSLLFNKRVGDI